MDKFCKKTVQALALCKTYAIVLKKILLEDDKI